MVMERYLTGVISTAIILSFSFLTGCSHTNSGSSSYSTSIPFAQPSYSFSKSRPPTGRSVFVFDPKHTAFGAYNAQGILVRQGRASGGKSYCPDVGRPCRTPSGSFRIYRKGGVDCKSSKYPVGEGGAPMPNCMFFHGGYSIHGSGHVPNYNASHGCIRVVPSDAAWLNNNFLKMNSQVVVRSY